MSKEQLLSLREQIMNDITPLALEGSGGAASFGILLRVIQAGNATADVYSRAYESAKAIQDKDQRLDALLSLLDEIDFDTTRSITQGEVPATQQPTAENMPPQQQ